ncbi:hypothetical protein AO498_10230 [Algoriphagus sanaruensis]|uniref:Uncharacterized protein n=1 Tax=Algoriphagus sanaruensis TaxID=1727163 RepID=A0A142ENV0_9BACT|nr:hypothetical protein AO498_10230 [Algoriphagus sanaruensis]
MFITRDKSNENIQKKNNSKIIIFFNCIIILIKNRNKLIWLNSLIRLFLGKQLVKDFLIKMHGMVSPQFDSMESINFLPRV